MPLTLSAVTSKKTRLAARPRPSMMVTILPWSSWGRLNKRACDETPDKTHGIVTRHQTKSHKLMTRHKTKSHKLMKRHQITHTS